MRYGTNSLMRVASVFTQFAPDLEHLGQRPVTAHSSGNLKLFSRGANAGLFWSIRFCRGLLSFLSRVRN
jgi:hypothetical protein